MQLLFLQGKAAMTYNGTWLLEPLQAGTPTVPFDLHVAPLPLVDGASKARSILAWAGVALPAKAAANRDSVDAFLEYASRPAVDAAVVEGLQSFSPIPGSNGGIHDPVAREFLPMLDDADHVAQLAVGAGDRRRDRRPGPGARQGRHRPRVGRGGHPGRRRWAAVVGSQLLPLRSVTSSLLDTKLYAPRRRTGLVPDPRARTHRISAVHLLDRRLHPGRSPTAAAHGTRSRSLRSSSGSCRSACG